MFLVVSKGNRVMLKDRTKQFEGRMAPNCDVKVSFDAVVSCQLGPYAERKIGFAQFQGFPDDLDELKKVELALEATLEKVKNRIRWKLDGSQKKEQDENVGTNEVVG